MIFIKIQFNEECNSNKKRKILIVFNDTIADMLCNKKLNLRAVKLLLEVENNHFCCFC